MFNRKELDKIKDQLEKHEYALTHQPAYVGTTITAAGKYRTDFSTGGIIQRLDFLESENKKLKAILAEVVDYVYQEKG